MLQKITFLILFLFFSFTAASQDFIGDSGLYVSGSSDIPLSTSYYSKSFVDGGAIRTKWEAIEPNPGNYDFSFIDGEIATAESFGKKIGIAILKQPLWLVDSLGAEGYSYVDQNVNHPTYGDTLFHPLKYDSVVISRYKLLMDELALYYALDTSISYFHIFSGVSNDIPKTVADGTPFYQAHFYDPDTLINRLKGLTIHYMNLFPNTPLWNSPDIIRFEPQATGLSKVYVAENFMAWGASVFPDRFGVWREDLSSCTNVESPNPNNHWSVLIQHDCRTGSQMVWNVQDGPTRMNQCLNAPQDYSASSKAIVMDSAINVGLSINMRFFEIYKTDILDPDLDLVFTNLQDAIIDQIDNNCSLPPLPVELSYFKGYLIDNSSVKLEWQTLSENNNIGFEVEHSINGIAWQSLAFVESKGTSFELSNYEFNDNNPVLGLNYYRLKLIDWNEEFKYSSIVNVPVEKENDSQIYPNPSNGVFTIRATNRVTKVKVFNILGSLIVDLTLSPFQSENKISLDLSVYPAGVYLITIFDENGKNKTTKFTKEE